jgi:two-component system chemotaxis sensor kinase CheA
MNNNEKILDEFLLEAQEIFDQLEIDLVRLERDPHDKKLMGSIFRAMHTLKGSSGFFAFQRLEKVAHAGESLLTKMRDGLIDIDEDKTDILLTTLDCLCTIVVGIAQLRAEPQGDDSALLHRLHALGGAIEPSMSGLPGAQAPAWPVDPALHSADNMPPDPPKAAEHTPPNASLPIAAKPEPAQSSDKQDPTASLHLTDAARQTELMAPVKISIESLDKLMDLVSEMVLARNRLLSFAYHSGDANFTNTVRSIDLITLELQDRMMQTRMQPIANLWSKFPRLARDIAQECGKKIELVQIGSETELDRTLLDGIRDPLIHIIRNCIDHGIETPAVRIAQGKPEMGTVTLRSKHENGMVVIEISDDGAGIDKERIAQSALDKGLLTRDRLNRMNEQEIIDLIFLPGFSTKEQVSRFSGRGVGMDVVRTNVQKIGGSVEIATSKQGTEIRLKIPLTLAIMPAVFVQCANQRFAVPQANLLEMIRFESGDSRMEDMYGIPVFRLRNKLIPVLKLRSELKLTVEEQDSDRATQIVVVQAGGLTFGLVVDQVLFIQEVVVKSTGPLLKNTPIYSGATILGDGHVAMIFDVPGLAVHTGLVTKLLSKDFKPDLDPAPTNQEKTQTMLLFDLVHLQRVAIPLDYVDRLELFPLSRVEQRGRHEVIIYGVHIMKLIWLSDYIEDPIVRRNNYGDDINVIVHYHMGQPLGFVVKTIQDIVEIASEIILIYPPQKGIIGSSIRGEHVVSILNVDEILHLSELTPDTSVFNSSALIGSAMHTIESVAT